jgi:hypothetical protein
MQRTFKAMVLTQDFQTLPSLMTMDIKIAVTTPALLQK